MRVESWKNSDSSPPGDCETPDYENPLLRKTLQNFIGEMGKRYDGDARIGFITAGLLGLWGEWHDYPRQKLFASKSVQAEVMDAYAAAFKKTPILLRYPAGENDEYHASNHRRHFGYHDDSFAWATLETGKRNDGWFYMAALRTAGGEALDKWKTRPIGGEIRPEAWGNVFDAEPGNKKIQDFAKCIEATHATWLMDSGMFKKNVSGERRKRAEDLVRRMGYEFYVPFVTLEISQNSLAAKIEIINKGIAPFFYDWTPELALVDAARKIALSAHCAGKLSGILPGDPPRTWNEALDLKELKSGEYKVLLRVPNPLPNGNAVRFANEAQDKDIAGWMSLGSVTLKK